MKASARIAAAMIGLGGVCLLVGSMAVAQDGELGEVVKVRVAGNVDAAGVQKRIDEISDETDSLLGKYRQRSSRSIRLISTTVRS